MKLSVVFFFFLCVSGIHGMKSGPKKHCHKHQAYKQRMTTNSVNISYSTNYFEAPVDHFSFSNSDTFQLRYLVNNQFWDKDGGPIFFYTGNEGDIEMFCNNTGFMWDIAPKFKALIVFAEHRYYGKSLPYGDESFKVPAKLGYLTSEQALADFADLITHMKSKIPGAVDSPVIAFGGSYGGMLASWLRIKYPNVVVGAIAASAPIWWFGNLTPCDSFYKKVTEDFMLESQTCAENIKASWPAMNKLAETESGLQTLSKILRLCEPLKADQLPMLKNWFENVYGNLAMVDYPYPANFLENLPAWPIREVCKHLSNPASDGEEVLSMVASGLNVYFNYTGDTKCFNFSVQAQQGLSDEGWNYQACTEMVMPMCSNGETDMFEPSPWNLTEYLDGCKKTYNVTPRPNWVEIQYGGKNLQAASNIVFSNGKLDPWSGGGVLDDISTTVVAIQIQEGAHHLDLRGHNPADPPSVLAARSLETIAITKWIESYTTIGSIEWGFNSHMIGRQPSAFDGIVSFSRNYVPVWLGVIFLLLAILILILYASKIRKPRRRNQIYHPVSSVSSTMTTINNQDDIKKCSYEDKELQCLKT